MNKMQTYCDELVDDVASEYLAYQKLKDSKLSLLVIYGKFFELAAYAKGLEYTLQQEQQVKIKIQPPYGDV